MREITNALAAVIALLFFLFPVFQGSAAGLVPCSGTNCTLCDFFRLIDNVVDFLLKVIVFPIGALLLAVSGFMMIFSADSPENVRKGKTIFFSVLVGLVFILGSWLFVGFFLDVIGVADVDWIGPGTWFNIRCN